MAELRNKIPLVDNDFEIADDIKSDALLLDTEDTEIDDDSFEVELDAASLRNTDAED
jgi:hypothetical protein